MDGTRSEERGFSGLEMIRRRALSGRRNAPSSDRKAGGVTLLYISAGLRAAAAEPRVKASACRRLVHMLTRAEHLLSPPKRHRRHALAGKFASSSVMTFREAIKRNPRPFN
jgi:hypothetical protein